MNIKNKNINKQKNVKQMEPGIYQHYKGNMYEVCGVGIHTETLEPLVVYKPLYESEVSFWIRPYEMFISKVNIDGKEIPRFKKIDGKK